MNNSCISRLTAIHQNISFTATPTFDFTLITDEIIQIVEKIFEVERKKITLKYA